MADAKPNRPIPTRKIVDGLVVEDQAQMQERITDEETADDFVIPDHLVERTIPSVYRPIRPGQFNSRGAKCVYVARMPSGSVREDFE